MADPQLLARLFRQLFRRQYCQTTPRLLIHPKRTFTSASRRLEQASSPDSNWQQRSSNTLFPPDKTDEYSRYPLHSSSSIASRRTPPKRIKLLTRDFIEDSLYNPHYGYFSSPHLRIFSPPRPFDFPSIRSSEHFHRLLQTSYTEFEDALDNGPDSTRDELRQLWHTPTELFRPYYGEAIARYLVASYKLTLYPYSDLIIYELGAGNGTLMLNILDYLEHHHPEVYSRTQFRIIEISPPLAQLQRRHLTRHPDRITIVNTSIFDWTQYDPSHCFVLAMEVFDNFAHDCIRYASDPPHTPHQSSVLIDGQGEFYEFYSPQLDPLAARYLRARDAALPRGTYPHPLHSRGLRSVLRRGLQRAGLPLAGANLSEPEWIPTRLLQFFEILAEVLPNHRLLTSDFDRLPDTIDGLSGPVVQTRYKRRTVTVSTPYVSCRPSV